VVDADRSPNSTTTSAGCSTRWSRSACWTTPSIPQNGAEGVLLAQGGYTLFVADSRPRFSYNYVGRDRFDVVSPEPMTPGRHAVRFEFEPTGKPDIRNGKGAPGRG
jgi:hypothetical protein